MTHPKSALIAYCRTKGLAGPEFDTRGTGPEHDPLFISDVMVNGTVVATGQGRTKREAERIAAELAYEALKSTHGEIERKSGSGGRKKKRKSSEPSNNEASPALTSWPIFPEVLAEALRIANQRLPNGLKGLEAAEQVTRLTTEIYKGLLEDLTAEAVE